MFVACQLEAPGQPSPPRCSAISSGWLLLWFLMSLSFITSILMSLNEIHFLSASCSVLSPLSEALVRIIDIRMLPGAHEKCRITDLAESHGVKLQVRIWCRVEFPFRKGVRQRHLPHSLCLELCKEGGGCAEATAKVAQEHGMLVSSFTTHRLGLTQMQQLHPAIG